MKNAQNPDHASLNTIINRLREGRYVIPDFQREFEWQPWDIRDLVRSIFLDYYIGNLLLWKGKAANIDGLSCEPIYAFGGKPHPEHIVLDGQQRLTAMHYAFFGPEKRLPNRSNRAVFYVDVARFMDEQDRDSAFGYDFWSNRVARLLASPDLQYAAHMFPMKVMGEGGWALPNWVQGYQRYWEDRGKYLFLEGDSINAEEASTHAQNAMHFGKHVKEISEEYQISYIELDEELPIDKVCDIFTQLNSKGVRLDVFDLMNALLKPKNVQLKQMWRDAQQRLTFVNTSKMNVYILQVVSIFLQGHHRSPKYLYYMIPGQQRQIRDPDGSRHQVVVVNSDEEFNIHWKDAVDHLEKAIKLLRHPQEFGAISSNYLPYESIVPVFAAINAYLGKLPPPLQLAGKQKLQQWYWASVFLNRYSGSVESTSTRDYIDMTAWLDGSKEAPPLIAEFKARVPVLDLRNQTRSGTSIYNGIFNLLVLAGARDWITGNAPQHDDLHDHHIVPASWVLKNFGGAIGNSILNRTPLTSKTNSAIIRDRLPNQYLPELMAANGASAVREALESHYISPAAFDILLRDPFTVVDFEAFLTERQRTILAAIEELLVKERLDLPPDLRLLDRNIEEIELGIRRLIADGLGSDAETVPSHISLKIEERVVHAARKDPAFDQEFHDTLDGMLEFADLRELQEIICSKSIWPCFQSQFPNKEMVAVRFGQLAEARNSLRHSRSLSEVARKDGEAAVAWFSSIIPPK